MVEVVDSIALRVTLPGAESTEDAWQAVAVLQKLLVVLGQLEDLEVGQEAGRVEERGKWRFQDLRLGSVTTTVAPSRPRRGATLDQMADTLMAAVDGFAYAEQEPGVPPDWNVAAARAGADLARLLAATPEDGLQVELLKYGQPQLRVILTRAAERHLTTGVNERHLSIGSIIGRLDTATLHHRREASLWLDHGGERVPVSFAADAVDVVRSAWGRRVEVSGMVERDRDGHLMRVRMRRLEILPGLHDSPDLTDFVGLDPNLTDDRDPHEYLGDIRGAAQ